MAHIGINFRCKLPYFGFYREMLVDHEEIMITKMVETFLREMEILEIFVL